MPVFYILFLYQNLLFTQPVLPYSSPPCCIENDSKFYCQIAQNFSTQKLWFSDTPLWERVIEKSFQRVKFLEEAEIEIPIKEETAMEDI